MINQDRAVFLKYNAKKPNRNGEYLFNFNSDNLKELRRIKKEKAENIFIALVCVRAKEICCLPYEELLELIEMRRKGKGEKEDTYSILVTVPAGKKMRVYVNKPFRKGITLGERLVNRSAFPKQIFQ